MTTVKIQRPMASSQPEHNWMIYDQYRARTCFIAERALPREVLLVFASASQGVGQFKQYFDDATWNDEAASWDLSSVKPVTRRLTW